MGVAAPDDAIKHVRAIYNAPRQDSDLKPKTGSHKKEDPLASSPFAQIVRVWPQTYEELCSVEPSMSRDDLEAVGLSRDQMTALIKRAKPVPVKAVTTYLQDHLRSASQSVKSIA